MRTLSLTLVAASMLAAAPALAQTVSSGTADPTAPAATNPGTPAASGPADTDTSPVTGQEATTPKGTMAAQSQANDKAVEAEATNGSTVSPNGPASNAQAGATEKPKGSDTAQETYGQGDRGVATNPPTSLSPAPATPSEAEATTPTTGPDNTPASGSSAGSSAGSPSGSSSGP